MKNEVFCMCVVIHVLKGWCKFIPLRKIWAKILLLQVNFKLRFTKTQPQPDILRNKIADQKSLITALPYIGILYHK